MSTPAAAGTSRISLGRNAVSNVSGLLIYLSIAFFLSPFIIRTLGNARYGTWSLVAELVGYYGLLDLGLRGAVGYFVAHYTARGERDRLSSSICSAFWVLAAIGSALAITGGLIALQVPNWFVRGDINPVEATVAMLIMSFTVGLNLPMAVFSSVLTGSRRMDLVNAVEISGQLLIAGATYAALRAGGGLISLAAAQCVGRLMMWTCQYLQAQRVTGGFSLRPGRFRRFELRRLAGLGSMSLVINIAETVINRTDLIVVGAFLGVKWVAYYNIGRLLVNYATQIVANLGWAFTPHLTHLHSQQRFADTRRLFLKGARVSGLLALPLGACMLAFGHSFLGLWIGKAYVTGPILERSDSVMTVLLLAQLTRWPQSMSYQLIYSTGKYAVLMYLAIGQAVANISLTLLLVHSYGLVGVALGTLVPMAVCNLVILPTYVLRRFSISVREYISAGIGPPILTGALVLAFTQVLVRFRQPESWLVFLAEALLAVAVTALIAGTLGLKREDRDVIAARANGVVKSFVTPVAMRFRALRGAE